jgi:hypothetical protein
MYLVLEEQWDGINMKQWLKKITGIEKLEKEKAEALARVAEAKAREEEAEKAVKLAQEQEELAKMTPKDRASKKGEPWVGVLNTHVNKDNVRNGFFELDWNQEFIVQLKKAGYGFDGDPDEEIVDRWFRELASSMFLEEGLDPRNRTAGFINVVPLSKGKSEVS